MTTKKIITTTTFIIFLITGIFPQDTLNLHNARTVYDSAKELFNRPDKSIEDLNQARRLVSRALELDPNSCKYKYGMGIINYKLENWNTAQIWFKAVVLDADEICLTYQTETLLNLTTEKLVLLAQANDDNDGSVTRHFDFKDPSAAMIGDSKKLPRIDFNRDEFATLADYIISKNPELIKSKSFRYAVVDDDGSRLDKHTYNIDAAIKFLKAQYGFGDFNSELTIILSNDPARLRVLAKDLYPNEYFPHRNPFFGFFSGQDNLTMATSYSSYGTFLHELMHAFLYQEFQDAPLWLEEGLATMYERAYWKSGKFIPLPNWRMNFILYSDVSLSEIEVLTNRNSLYVDDLAKIRLFFLFLDQEDVLAYLYQSVKADRSDFQLDSFLENSGLENIETNWQRFVDWSINQYKMELDMAQNFIPKHQVRFIQEVLNLLIDAQLVVDGDWGTNTQSALINFQRQYGLEETGDYDGKTKQVLNFEFEKLAFKL